MSSSDIGETIDQFVSPDLIGAWNLWALSACDWIIAQLPEAGLNRKALIKEILSEKPILYSDAVGVWFVDLVVKHDVEVVQINIVDSGYINTT